MRPGLAEYDLASLLYDPYVHLGASERPELLEFYRDRAAVNDPAFEEKFRLCAMQRLMQALGAYGYLGHGEEKPATSSPTFPLRYDSLGEIVAEIEGSEPLRKSCRSQRRRCSRRRPRP